MHGLVALVLLGLAQAGQNLIRSAKDTPVPPIYPIGTKKEPFAKVSGTLFEIDGKVTYFAGMCHIRFLASLGSVADLRRNERLVAGPSKQERGCGQEHEPDFGCKTARPKLRRRR